MSVPAQHRILHSVWWSIHIWTVFWGNLGPTVFSLVTSETMNYFIVNFVLHCALRLVELQFQKFCINVENLPFPQTLIYWETETGSRGPQDLVLERSELDTLLGHRAHALCHINCFENFHLWPPYCMQHKEFPLRNKLQKIFDLILSWTEIKFQAEFCYEWRILASFISRKTPSQKIALLCHLSITVWSDYHA